MLASDKKVYIISGLFLFIYLTYLAFPLAVLTAVFAPYISLLFISEVRKAWIYLMIAAFIAAGAVLLPPLLTLFFLLTALIPAVFLALSRQSARFPWLGLLLCCLPMLTFVTVYLLPEANSTAVKEAMVSAVETFFAPYFENDAMRLSMPENALAFYNNREEYVGHFVKMIPAYIYVTIMVVMFFTEKAYYRIPHTEVFRLPDFLLGFIVLGGALLVFSYERHGTLGLNILISSGVFYFFRGFDILRFHMIRLNFFPVLRGFLYVLILMQTTLMASVAIMGLVSVYVKLIPDQEDKKDGAKQV